MPCIGFWGCRQSFCTPPKTFCTGRKTVCICTNGFSWRAKAICTCTNAFCLCTNAVCTCANGFSWCTKAFCTCTNGFCECTKTVSAYAGTAKNSKRAIKAPKIELSSPRCGAVRLKSPLPRLKARLLWLLLIGIMSQPIQRSSWSL